MILWTIVSFNVQIGIGARVMQCPNALLCGSTDPPAGRWCESCRNLFGQTLAIDKINCCGLCGAEGAHGVALPGCRDTLCTECVRWCFFTHHRFPYPAEMEPLRCRRVNWLNEQKTEARCPVCKRPIMAVQDRIRFRGRSP